MLRRTLKLILLVAAFALSGRLTAHADVVLPDNFVNEVIVEELDQPTSMAFLPDGRVLLTEQRNGKVRMVVNGHIASTDPIFAVPLLNTGGYERGLEGIAVDPRWPLRPYVYLYYTRNPLLCRLVRYKASGDLVNPLGETLTLTNPLLLIDDIVDNDPNHNSGCLRFGPDSTLFLSVGEDEDLCAAADSTRLKGAILRLDVMHLGDGTGGPVSRNSITPVDNPLVTTDPNARLVWAYGMRNPWRYQIDPVTKTIYSADVGENIVEELDEIHAGDYLGWPWREGNVTVARPYCPEPGGEGTHDYVKPIVELPRGIELTAIISAGIYRPIVGAPANWPARYDGNVFWGEYYTGAIRRIVKSDSTWVPATPEPGQLDSTLWATGLFSCVDFQVGPDGSLWWLRQFQDEDLTGVNGSLQRIRYVAPSTSVPSESRANLSLSSRPNPFSDAVEITFRASTPSYVRLELFDLSGRLVRRLLDASVPAGPQRARWDGLDRSGRRAPPGVYIARLESAAGVESRRLLRVR
jgi:glucose/arabinose dehydrogenase